VCAEHGDLHHGDAIQELRTAQDPGVAADQGSPTSLAVHEHCDGWFRVPQHVTHDAPPPTAPEFVDAPPAADLSATNTATAPIALLALAPKLAPPSV
jgi:hypothetical protein